MIVTKLNLYWHFVYNIFIYIFESL
jgi:heme/copper-type cytochrome/quinol oxidase subunit 3